MRDSQRNWRKPLVRWFLGTFAVLGTMLAVGWNVINWQGERAWTAIVAAHRAAKDPLDLEAIKPPPVSPEQNFAETPLLKELFQYHLKTDGSVEYDNPATEEHRQSIDLGRDFDYPALLSNGRLNFGAWNIFLGIHNDHLAISSKLSPAEKVLAGLHYWDHQLNELKQASQRPKARFDIHYEELHFQLLSHLLVLRTASRLLEAQSAAYLSITNQDLALQDILVVDRFGMALMRDPSCIGELLALRIQQTAARMAWTGMIDHLWSNEELATLKTMFAARDNPRAQLAAIIREERAALLSWIDVGVGDWKKFARVQFAALPIDDNGVSLASLFFRPKGLLRQNQVTMTVYFDGLLEKCPDEENWKGIPGKITAAADRSLAQRNPFYAAQSRMLLPEMDRVISRINQGLAINRMGEIACALERFRNDSGHYPPDLATLVPQYIASLPNDPMTGKALQYAATQDGWYKLYSVGANLTDDGGEMEGDPNQGDWAWPQPVKAKHRLF